MRYTRTTPRAYHRGKHDPIFEIRGRTGANRDINFLSLSRRRRGQGERTDCHGVQNSAHVTCHTLRLPTLMSLRKRPDGSKEAKAALPRTQQRLQKGGKDAPKSRVDDKIKKRMSMRYADISEPSRLSIPNVPSLPSGPRSGPPGKDQKGQEQLIERPEAQEDSRKADMMAMEQENFDPEACEFVYKD